MLTPASLGLVLTALPGGRVADGVRLWAVSAALAGAAGPVVGGHLTVPWPVACHVISSSHYHYKEGTISYV